MIHRSALMSLVALLLSAVSAIPTPVNAEVELTFYAHSGTRIRGGWLYFPHAYIGLTGHLTDGTLVDEYLGFTAATPGPHLLFIPGPGAVSPPDQRYRSESRRGLSVLLPDKTYVAVMERINLWRSPAGSVYNLRRRNCITFVEEVARAAGLVTSPEATLSPSRFLSDLARLNADPLAP